MYKTFSDIESLCLHVAIDKQAKGMGAANLDRYPIRFVLFDNFKDSYAFVDYLQTKCCVRVESVDKWIDLAYPDLMITQMELAECISDYINKQSPNDCVIAPFSELARFYDNQESKSFDALLKTIKAIQATPVAIDEHQRVYIPIVGLEGKMSIFSEDSQINIWQLSSEYKEINYRLIVTDNADYGVQGLEENYTIVNNIRDWLNLWKDGRNIKQQIICKSHSIFANANFAQPDNAFSYEICHNAQEFLSNGLQLSFGGIRALANDGKNWDLLAQNINVLNGFSFKKYVLAHFEINEIDNYKDFIRLWFANLSVFDRWLLARYYSDINNDEGFLCQILLLVSNYGTNQLIEQIALSLPENDGDITIRNYCLRQAINHYTQLTESVEGTLAKSLLDLSNQKGYTETLKLFTGITRKEKEIAISWVGRGLISVQDLKPFFPDLYEYLKDGVGISAGIPEWVEDYFCLYKNAKIANKYSDSISEKINELNASEATFDTWYNDFSTTYTILKDRGDIEVFYWIDGLGVDWIPLVKQIISEKKGQEIFVNEIKIARALRPTKTDVNKVDLQRLLPNGVTLEKSGDLDAQAHKTGNISPFSIIDEILLVRKCIEEVLRLYIGKKIAIISDHGLTYLSQLLQGKNMAGVDSDHHGRIAICHKQSDVLDNSYIRLEDGKTLCALRHESLCKKVPSGQGIHGGCTPEEVLVPIFVISSSPAATNWSASLVTTEIDGTKPRVQFSIKNLPSTDKPYVLYNNTKYNMYHLNGDIYESEDMILDANTTTISIVVGDDSREMKIKVSTGVLEVNLFDF